MPVLEGASAPFVVIGGSAIFIILVSVLGFGGKETLIPLEVHFGMVLDISGGPIVKVWAKTPLPAYIETIISNLSKRHPDGTVTLGVDMFELFPTGEDTNYGGGTARFSMMFIDPAAEPLLNTTMQMIPMVFKRDIPINAFENVVLSIASFSLNNWSAVSWGIILTALAMFGGALALLVVEQKKGETLVESIVPD